MTVRLSCREQVVRAIEARLAALPVTGLRVLRDYDQDGPTTDLLPCLLLDEGQEDEHDDWVGCRTWALTVTVEGIVVGAPVQDPDAEPWTPAEQLAAARADAAARAAELRALVDNALLGEVSLGGLARDLYRDPERQPVPAALDGAEPTKSFAVAYVVEFTTAESDLFTFA